MAVTPVVVGASLAWAEGAAANWPVFVLTLACAVLIQVGTNLLNDVSDFETGNDRADRVGPLRVTAAGWATPSEVRRAAGAAFGLAMVIGVALVWLGGLVILGLGLFSIIAGWAYSGGSLDADRGAGRDAPFHGRRQSRRVLGGKNGKGQFLPRRWRRSCTCQPGASNEALPAV